MRILFLSAWFPYPPNNGSKLRIYNLLRGLSRNHDVTLVTFADDIPAALPAELSRICRDVHVVTNRRYDPTSARALLGLLSPTPRSIVDTFVPGMRQAILRELNRGGHDLVVASEWSTAAYLVDMHGLPAIFEDLEIGHFEAMKARSSTPWRPLRHQLTLLKLRAYARRLLPRFSACTVVSATEAALVHGLAPEFRRVEVIPNAVSLADYSDIDATLRPNTLIFTGSLSYFANHDAMVWFLREVFPRIRARIADVQLVITGDHLNLPLPYTDNVTLTGFVDDVRPLIASAAASLAPIRMGGGTRLKILEAMALHTPVVATSKGAEGLEVRNNQDILIADHPNDLADAIVRVLTEPGLRRRLSESAHHLIKEKYDWDVIMPNFVRLVETIAPALQT